MDFVAVRTVRAWLMVEVVVEQEVHGEIQNGAQNTSW
jgi:hypothetical protein